MSIEELLSKYNWIRDGGRIGYEVYGTLNEILRPFCFNDGKEWNNAEREQIKRFLPDPFNPLNLCGVVAQLGRTPYAVYNMFLRLVWEEARKGNFKLLNRTFSSAVNHKHAFYL